MKTHLTFVAAALFLAACSTAAEDSAVTGGQASAEQQAAEQAGQGASGAAQDEIGREEIAGPAAGTQEHLVVNVGDRVFFEFDSSSLTEEATETVDRLAAWMDQNGGTSIIIEGHADERGTRDYNLALGARRANAIRDHLSLRGIDTNRLETVSYGEERPAVMGSNDRAWAQNRRAVFVVEGAPVS